MPNTFIMTNTLIRDQDAQKRTHTIENAFSKNSFVIVGARFLILRAAGWEEKRTRRGRDAPSRTFPSNSDLAFCEGKRFGI